MADPANNTGSNVALLPTIRHMDQQSSKCQSVEIFDFGENLPRVGKIL
jgi:hypothetical protein